MKYYSVGAAAYRSLDMSFLGANADSAETVYKINTERNLSIVVV